MSDKTELDLTAQCLLTIYNSAKTLINGGLLNNVQSLINNGNDDLQNLLSSLNKNDDQLELDSSSSSSKTNTLYLNPNQRKNNTDLINQNSSSSSSTNNTSDNKKVHRCTFEGCSKVYGNLS